MTKVLRLLTPLALLFALSACKEIKVKNGEVPDEYRAMAQNYMGTYSGMMEGNRATVTLAFQGHKVVLTYKDSSGTDILDPRCDSRIGNLESVNVSKIRSLDDKAPVNYKLDTATFAFDPNRCWGSVDGREIVLDFSKKAARIRVGVIILLREDRQSNCRIGPGNPHGGFPPGEICDQQPIARYATGRFSN